MNYNLYTLLNVYTLWVVKIDPLGTNVIMTRSFVKIDPLVLRESFSSHTVYFDRLPSWGLFILFYLWNLGSFNVDIFAQLFITRQFLFCRSFTMCFNLIIFVCNNLYAIFIVF